LGRFWAVLAPGDVGLNLRRLRAVGLHIHGYRNVYELGVAVGMDAAQMRWVTGGAASYNPCHSSHDVTHLAKDMLCAIMLVL
jgi:hypothetical protein